MEKIEKQPKKAVIFDMDGVIFDSEVKVVECWKVVAEKYGIDTGDVSGNIESWDRYRLDFGWVWT